MRLWHESLIPKLPREQLLGQWRECIALLGNGWGRKHSTVNYVYEYDESYLLAFARLVSYEMISRGYHPNLRKAHEALRRRHLSEERIHEIMISAAKLNKKKPIYPEHNNKYLQECIDNLKNKGIEIS